MDAYTLRKVAPRILIGVVGINLSIYLCLAAIDITNVVGGGLYDLVTTPFDTAKFDNYAGDEIGVGDLAGGLGAGLLAVIVLVSGSIAAIAVVGNFLTLFLFIMAMVLMLLLILFVLLIRQNLLVLMTILSPVAVALWILPNTEKYFRQWWDLFLKLLIVYPIIAAMFAISDALVTLKIDEAADGDFLPLILALFLAFAPLFMIPFAFRFAGGALSGIMNAGSTPLKRLNEYRRERTRKQVIPKNMESIRSGNRWAGGKSAVDGKRGNFRGRLNKSLQTAAIVGSGQAGVNPRGWKDRMFSERSRGTMLAAQKAVQDEAWGGVFANDDMLSAALYGDRNEQSARQFLAGLKHDDGVTPKYSGRELEQNVATLRSARRTFGDRNFEVASAVALAGTKTGYSDGAGQMMAQILDTAGDDHELSRGMAFAARSQAANAQRYDLSEAGAGEYLSGLEYLRQHNNSGTAQATVTERVADDIVANKPAGYVGAGHSNSVKNLIPALNRRVDSASEAIKIARATKNPESIARAERQMKQVLAHSANVLDSATSNGNEQAMKIADEHLNKTYTNAEGKQVRVSQAFEQLRSDPEFAQMRREYGSGREEDESGRSKETPGETPTGDVGGAPKVGP